LASRALKIIGWEMQRRHYEMQLFCNLSSCVLASVAALAFSVFRKGE
jgi:hypothetical protein